MNNKFKILDLLNKHSGKHVNISPLIGETRPDFKSLPYEEQGNLCTKITKFVRRLQTDGLIDYQDFTIGNGNSTIGKTWVDKVNIMAVITDKGTYSFYREVDREKAGQLTDSMLETNKSVIISQKWSIGLGALSVLFIAITAIQTYSDKTAKRVQELQPIMQMQSYKI